MASNPIKSDENRSKRKKEAKNEASENPPLPSLEKKDLSLSECHRSHQKAPETILNDASKEINALLSNYGSILSEKAAIDSSYVAELEGILKEARSIEHHLKLKRENVRSRFSEIAAIFKVKMDRRANDSEGTDCMSTTECQL